MHVDVTPGRVTLSGSEEQLYIVWRGLEGYNKAEFRIKGNRARLASINVPQANREKYLMVGDPELSYIPLHFRLIVRGAGYTLKEPGEVLD